MASRASAQSVTDELVQADSAVHRLVRPYRTSAPVKAVSWFSELGDQPQLRILSGACVAAGLIGSDRRLLRAGLGMLLAHEVATLAKNFVKDAVDRSRPRHASSVKERRPRPGNKSAKEETSFPSGHTAGSVAVARAFAREYPEHSAAALGTAALVAAAQVPRCAHYVSDVGAGALIGIASEAATSLVLARR